MFTAGARRVADYMQTLVDWDPSHYRLMRNIFSVIGLKTQSIMHNDDFRTFDYFAGDVSCRAVLHKDLVPIAKLIFHLAVLVTAH